MICSGVYAKPYIKQFFSHKFSKFSVKVKQERKDSYMEKTDMLKSIHI